jgi:hypothetical protein
MSKNPEIIVFTPESLEHLDLHIAAKVHQATVLSTLRAAASMNSGQLVQVCSNGGRGLYWTQDKLEKVLKTINSEE